MLFLLFLLAAGTAALTGWLFPTGAWYRDLRKPAWTPPNWAFPVAWTALYVLMAVAGALVAASGDPRAGVALAFWALQIAANAVWTPAVFGARRLRVGFGVMAVLWLAVLGCLVASARVSSLAGALLVPYLLWVSYAAALNAALIRLNPSEGARRRAQAPGRRSAVTCVEGTMAPPSITSTVAPSTTRTSATAA